MTAPTREEALKRYKPLVVSPADAERFWRRTRRDESGCLIFEGCRSSKNYRQIWIGNRMEFAHRVAFVLGGGELTPERPYVLHRCDNPACCEITHLWAGDHADNQRDKAVKARGRRSKSGLPTNVHRNPRGGKYQVILRESGYHGSFTTWQEAAAIAAFLKNARLFPELLQ